MTFLFDVSGCIRPSSPSCPSLPLPLSMVDSCLPGSSHLTPSHSDSRPLVLSVSFSSRRCYRATLEVIPGACLCFTPIIVSIKLIPAWTDESLLPACVCVLFSRHSETWPRPKQHGGIAHIKFAWAYKCSFCFDMRVCALLAWGILVIKSSTHHW